MSDGARVLIVDDDADIREMLRAVLEANGFEVETLIDGIDALDPGRSYEAILLDVHMPIFDGDRLIDYWLMTTPRLLERVIVMTGYTRRRSGQASQAFAVVEKPFRYEDIVRLVRECAGRASSAAVEE